MALPTSHIELCNMLYYCIDLSDYPKGSTLKGIIESEKMGKLSIPLVEDWLRGLPSACTMPFVDSEIIAILESCGNSGWSIDDYWRFAASRIMDFAKYPNAYRDK